MFITITSSSVPSQHVAAVEAFLAEFLPRMKKFPGVRAIYHYTGPEKGDEATVVVWDDEQAVHSYRQSDLIQEALAYERSLGIPSTREGYPLTIALA